MNNEKIEKLEPLLREVRPEDWADVLEKYKQFAGAKRQELSEEIKLDDQAEAVDLLVDDLTEGALNLEEKRQYVDALETLLDANLNPPKPHKPFGAHDRTQDVGFAKMSEEDESGYDFAASIIAALSKDQKVDILEELEKTNVLDEAKQRKLAQIDMIQSALSAIVGNIRNRRTKLEKVRYAFDYVRGENNGERTADYYEKLITDLDSVKLKIATSNEPLDKLIDENIPFILAHEWPDGPFQFEKDSDKKLVIGPNGRYVINYNEAGSDKSLVDQYISLIDFMREGQRDYAEVGILIENVLMKPEFDQARDMYFKNLTFSDEQLKRYREIKAKLSKMDGDMADNRYVNQVEYQALLSKLREFEDDVKGVDEHGIPGDFRHRGFLKSGLQNSLNRNEEKRNIEKRSVEFINEKTRTPEVIKSWTEAGLSEEQQEDFRKRLIEEDTIRKMNVFLAKKTDNELFTNVTDPQKREIMDRYRRAMGTGKSYEMSDATWNKVVDEFVMNAPLIILSGGVAAAARGVLSLGARAVVMSSRWATAFNVVKTATGATRLALTAEAGLGARAAYLGGRWVVSPLVGGAAFEVTHASLNEPELFVDLMEQLYGSTFGTPDDKKHLRSLPEWGKNILWTTATLGTFHVVGEEAKIFSQVLLEGSKIFPEKSVRYVIAQFITTGNIEAAAMLGIGALRHGIEEGNFNNWNTVDELIHAFVAVGALKVSGGAIKLGGKVFRPPTKPEGGKPERSEIERPEGKGKESLINREVLNNGGEIEVKTGEGLVEVLTVLIGEGYEVMEGRAVKDGKVIELKMTSDLAEAMNALKSEAGKLDQAAKDLAAGKDGSGEAARRALEDAAANGRRAGLPRRLAFALSVLLFNSGCEKAIETIGNVGGGAVGIAHALSVMIPVALLTVAGVVATSLGIKASGRHYQVKGSKKVIELQGAVSDANRQVEGTGTTTAETGRQLADLSEALRKAVEKADDTGGYKTKLNRIANIARDFADEAGKNQPNNDRLAKLTKKLDKALEGFRLPDQPFFNLGNSVKIIIILAALAAAVGYSVGMSDSSDDKEKSYEDLMKEQEGGDSSEF